MPKPSLRIQALQLFFLAVAAYALLVPPWPSFEQMLQPQATSHPLPD